MRNSQYTYPFKSEIFRQSFNIEVEKTKTIVEKKISIIKSLESLDEPSFRQIQYSESLRNEASQLVALVEAGDNLCESFIENLEKLSNENNRLSQENQRLKSINRFQETQVKIQELIREKKKGVGHD